MAKKHSINRLDGAEFQVWGFTMAVVAAVKAAPWWLTWMVFVFNMLLWACQKNLNDFFITHMFYDVMHQRVKLVESMKNKGICSIL